jgi:ADP-ribosylglycohydrolase
LAKEPVGPEDRRNRGRVIQNERTQEIKGTGYIVDSLEAALWAFDRSRSFREGALLAVNLGNDADTTGAIYGQLAGAFYGAEQIPAEWRTRLVMHNFIVETADKLVQGDTLA